MVFPNPEETATLIVNGEKFTDWETVLVRHAMMEHPFFHFRFTCSEPLPLSANIGKMQILPGTDCTVILAGELAITGLVCSRQVFYDGRRHHIEIQGASNTMLLASASAITKTGEFKNVTYEQYARALIKPIPGMNFIPVGQIPTTKFPRISIPPGTSILDALDIPLRSLGGVQLTSNPVGDLVAVAGTDGQADAVVEGKNILEGREIIYNVGMATGTYGIGARPGNNQVWGAKASHQNFVGNQFQNLSGDYAPQVIHLESPVWEKSHLQGRTNMDRDWQNEDQVTVFATLQGWLRPSGGLWQIRQMVSVDSPMLVMKGTSLKAKSINFTQDNQSGTRTTLELCNPAALAGEIPQGPGGG